MSGTNTPDRIHHPDHSSAVHKPFSWLSDDVKDYPMADFTALTIDVCRGIQTCLEIVHVSNLERASNAELDPEDAELPLVNAFDTTKLLRLSIASATLLQQAATDKLSWINAHGAGHLRAMKNRAK